ncbi:MAG: DUF2061 domain-containing protein [Rhodospirillaceae bacterium]
MARKIMKTGTYSVMYLAVAVTVAFALTSYWRIALGIGLIKPLVQTVAYTIHKMLRARAGGGRDGPAVTPPALRQSPV